MECNRGGNGNHKEELGGRLETLDTESVCPDTDIMIDNLRGDKIAVHKIMLLEDMGRILSTTSVNAFELYYGALKTERRQRNRDAVERLLSRLVVYDFTKKTAEKAGEIIAHLDEEGKPIDFRDAFIAATAIINESLLYTRNISHFERIPDLEFYGQ
jgi:tRNA(fMet)-specific endonuclease VapC